jgi:hypothetical protein
VTEQATIGSQAARPTMGVNGCAERGGVERGEDLVARGLVGEIAGGAGGQRLVTISVG